MEDNNVLSGVYCIRNIVNNKVYIGSSVNIDNRKKQHFNKLKKGTHLNKHLQSAFLIYGAELFEFDIVEIVNLNCLISREQYWMDCYKSWDRNYGYNIQPKANRTEHSDETKALISASGLKRFANPVARERMRKISISLGLKPPSRKNCKMSDEAKKKIGIASKGRIVTKETRQKISNTLKGHTMSEERRKKISNSVKKLWATYGGAHFGRK